MSDQRFSTAMEHILPRLTLAEQIADLLVDVAQVVDVGGGAVGGAVLHQVLLEQRLQLVPLPHNCQLQNKNNI